MFEIDKKKLGAFILELRKEKGYTQKELAEQLYISDKNTGRKKQWRMAYILCLLICFIELIYTKLYIDHDLLTIVIITAIMGGYFCLFAKENLPVYYDENRINIFSDGILRMHIPGIALTISFPKQYGIRDLPL